MKTYSSQAVTASDVSALDEKQSREIEKLKTYVKALAATQLVVLGILIGQFWFS